MDELKKIVKRLGLSKDDLIQEAELVEEYGEYFHMALVGYRPEAMRDLTETL